MKNKLAKTIRAISVPPIVVTIMAVALFLLKTTTLTETLFLFLFLGFIPFLSYPLSFILKKRSRDEVRKLAFIFSIISYTLGLFYSLFIDLSIELEIIYLTYFLSVLILTFINKVIKVKASGHMTSITGPLLISIYLIGFKSIFITLALYILVFWSSLYLKRHTKREMILGSLTVLISFLLANIIYMF